MMTVSNFARKGLALAVIGTALTMTMANDAEARWRRGYHRGGGFAAAAIGGLAAGAILGAATAPAYGYSYGYAPAYSAPTTYYYDDPQYVTPAYATPTYYRPYRARPVVRRHAAYGEPVCTVTRRKVWLSANTYTFRRATVCR